MYILEIENKANESGYLAFEYTEGFTYPEFYSYEGDNAISCPVTLEDKEMLINLMPTGQIFINRHNAALENFKSAGGDLQELIKTHKSGKFNFHLYNNFPFVPWVNGKKSNKDFDLIHPNIDESEFIKSSIILFEGKESFLFEVENIDCLYAYDIYRIKQKRILLKECEVCGKAFFVDTNDKYCENCRDEAVKRQSQENLKNNPVKSKRKYVRDRAIEIFKNKFNDEDYYNNFKKYVRNFSLDELEKWQYIFKKYNELDLFINSASFDGDFHDIGIWNEEKQSKMKSKNPELWLKSWYEKADKQW